MPHQRLEELAGSDEARTVTTDVRREKGTLESKFMRCDYGAGNSNDYVLHIEPTHERRPFPQNLSGACNIVRQHLLRAFPAGVTVEIDLPEPDWVVQHIVFCARGAVQQWNFNEEDVEHALPALLDALDAYVEQYAAANRNTAPRPGLRSLAGRNA